MWIHPALDKAMVRHPDLTAAERLLGFRINKSDYDRFIQEADTAVPHLDASMRHLWAVYNAQRHPDCSTARPKKVRALGMRANYLILALEAVILCLLVLLFATHGHAQEPAGALKHNKGQEAAALPATVMPLDDADKVKLLKLLREQDQAIITRRDHQLEIEQLDKRIADLQNQINVMAQNLAKQGRIDTENMVLDLDKLAWLMKEIAKEQPK